MVLGITEHTYAAVSVICPICHHGSSKQFTPFNSRMGKLFGGAAAKKSQAEAAELLTLLGKQINLSATRSYYETLSWLEKRRYRAMLDQLRLNDLVLAIHHG